MTTISRQFTPDDRAASIYQYLPFEVPADAAGFTVTLAYQRDPAIVDLGLAGPDRWGGWSGGERSTVTVTPDWATPGYVAGVVAGDWNVVLGLHRVGPDGVDVAVELDLHHTAPSPPPAEPPVPAVSRPPRRLLPASAGREWLACDFHSHTVHSDGGLSIDALAATAAEHGLDVLAITDHNTVSHHPLLPAAAARAGVVLVPGQEITTDTGHANCFGDVGWIDFRRPADDWFADAAERGGLFSINHPWAWDCAWRKPFAGPAPFVEAWHCTWDRRDPTPLAEWSQFGLMPIGGSDFHRFEHFTIPGRPTTWVECEERSVEAVLAAMVEGRIGISAGPDSPVLLPLDGEVVAVDAESCQRTTTDHGTVLTDADGQVVAFVR